MARVIIALGVVVYAESSRKVSDQGLANMPWKCAIGAYVLCKPSADIDILDILDVLSRQAASLSLCKVLHLLCSDSRWL